MAVFTGGLGFFASGATGAAGASLPWTPSTPFDAGTMLLYNGNIYEVPIAYTSGATIAADIAAGDIVLVDSVGSIVWKEGGVTNDNVYGTWGEVKEYIEDFDGQLTVFVDDTITANPIINSDVNLNNVLLIGENDVIMTNVSVASGVTITDLTALRNIALTYLGTAKSTQVLVQGINLYFSSIIPGGTVSPFTLTTGFISFLGRINSSLKTGVIELIDVTSPAIVNINSFSGSTIEDDILTGNGDGQFSIHSDSGAISETQTNHTGTLSIFRDNVNLLAYNPAVPTAWPAGIDDPAAALDALQDGKARFKTALFDYTDFTPGGAVNTFSITAFTLPAGYKLKDVEIEVDPGGFAGVGSVKFDLGITGNLDKYLCQNIDFAGIAGFETSEPEFIESKTTTTDVLLTVTVDTTVAALTSGSGSVAYRYIDSNE